MYNIKDIIDSVGGDLTGNFDAKRQLYNTLKGLSEEQVKATLTSGQFDKQTAKVLLRLKGYNKETIKAMLTTGKFADTVSNGVTPLENLGKAAGEFGKQLLSGFKQLGLFLATNPIGWIIDAAAATALLVVLYKKFNISAEEDNKNLKNAFDESKSQIKSAKEQKDTVDQLADSYEKLSKGVNTATNENISLSTDSYKEYLDVCNQIADIYPDLVIGYDAQGNAILSLKGNVDGLLESYKKVQQEAYATAYIGVKDEDGKRTGTAKDRLAAYNAITDPNGNHSKRIQNATKNSGNVSYTPELLISEYKKMINMSDEELKAYITSTDSGASMVAKQFVNTIADGTKESFDEVRKISQENLNSLLGDNKEVLKNEATALEGYMKGVTDASGNALASGYDKLTEKQQNLATSLLSTIDVDTLEGFKKSGDFAKAEQKWVDNLVSSVSNMSATAKNAYDKLQDSIANPDDLTSAGIENIDKYLDTLGSELNISKDKLKEIFNLDDIFDTQTSFDNLVKQYLGEDTFNELSNGAKKAANSIDKLAESEMNHKASMITLNERYKKNLEEKAKQEQQEQYAAKVQAEEDQKRQKQSEESAKRHANGIVVANERIKKNRQEELKQQEPYPNQKVVNTGISNAIVSSEQQKLQREQQKFIEEQKKRAEDLNTVNERIKKNRVEDAKQQLEQEQKIEKAQENRAVMEDVINARLSKNRHEELAQQLQKEQELSKAKENRAALEETINARLKKNLEDQKKPFEIKYLNLDDEQYQKKYEEASQRRAKAETTINNRLKKQNEERAKQEEAQQQRANDMATVNARVKTNLAEQEQKQAEEQQKQAEKNARWEKDYQIEAELAAKKREKNVTSEEEAQKKLSSEYQNMTLSQKKMFLEANNGSNGLVETYEKYNKLLENNALNSLPFEIDDITTHITNLNTALSESASATGLTSESIKNLTSMFSGLEGYNASTLFENTANGVKLNREELEKLNQAYADDKTKDAKDNLSLLTDKYNELTQEINNCSDTSKLANLYSQRDAVMDQINDVQQLISQYDGLTSAFNEWQNAQNETSPGANYDSMYSYIDTANKLAKDGKWGNPALKKYIELISGKDLSKATAIEMKQAWESLGGTIGDTGHNLMEFLSEDKTGVEKFVDTLKKLDKGYVQVGEDGQNIINIDNMDDLAQKMGTDVSYVQVLLDKLSEYGWDIHVNSSDLELLTTNAEKAEETLHDLGFEHVFNFSATGDDLTKEIDEAYKIFNDDRFKNENGEFDINIKGASEAQQVLVTLLSQKEALSEPLIMDINLDKLSGTNKQVIDNLQVIQSTIDGYQIQLGANMDTSEMEKKVGDSLDLIDKIPKDIQDKLGLSDQKVKNAAILLKKNIADGVTLDDTAVKTIEQALDSINPEILASLGIDMGSVQKDVDETAQAFETALTNVLSRLSITIDGKKIDFHVGMDTSEADEKFNELEEKKQLYGSGWKAVAGLDDKKLNETLEKDKTNLIGLTSISYEAYLRANNSALSNTISNSTSLLNDFNGKTAIAYIRVQMANKVPASTSALFNGLGLTGNQQINGTFHGFAGGTFLRGYSNGTSVALPRDEYALINEIGEEGILRNGVLHTVPGGAHIEHLRKNDIIFNAKQMEELRKTGYVQSGGGHGKMVGGYASGTLNGMHGYVVGTENNGSTVEYNVSGSGNIVGSTVQYKGADTTKDSSKSKSSNKSSSKKQSSGSNPTPSSTDSSSDAEKTKETLDWIETKISRVERVIKNLGKTVDATYKSWSERNQALYQEYSAVNGEIVDQQNAYERYLQEANNVGLDAGYAQLVRDGKIDIETITDDDLKQKIEDYKNWYEKALSCSDAILDLKDNLYDLLQTNFDSITKQFEDQLDVISHSVNMVEGYIDLAETRGYLASTDYYDSLINLERQNIGTLQNEYNSLATTLSNMVNAGQIEKYSEAWYDLYGQICDVEESFQDATKALSEYESKMRELKWSYFEKEQDYITNFTDEMSWLNDLLEKQGKLVDDNGNMTNRGTASMGLHAVGYNTYMSQADDYAKEIQKINEELAKDPFNTILIDKRQEYLKAQRDSIDAAYDEIDAAKSLMKDKYDAELDAIDKLIEKRKDAMSTERDLYNYQKSISEKVNSLSSLEKQRKAYEKDNSEEGMAKRQQLDKSIKDAKTDLQETEWDQQISDVEQMMDNMRDDYEDFLNQKLDDINFILNTMLDSANQNSESIKTTLTDATASVGTTLSETMANIWNPNSGLNGIVTGYSNTFSTALTTTNAALTSIKAMIKSMVQEAQRKTAEDTVMQQQMAQSTQAQQPTVPQTTQNQTTTAPQQVQNTGLDTGFFIYKQNSYPVSKLNVNSSIVDRLRWKNFDESFSARSSYYAAMGNGDQYTGSASQNIKILNWMKQNGFSTGGEITDLIGHTKDDGWALVGKKETIIDQQATQNLKDAIQMLNPLQNFINSMTTANVPNVPSTMSQNFENYIDVQMNFPNAKNYEEIKNALLVDNNFEKTMTQAILGGAMGQNSLKKRSMIK